MNTVIHLTPEETALALDVGRRKHELEWARGDYGAHGLNVSREEGRWKSEIGSLAEMAASKFLRWTFDTTVAPRKPGRKPADFKIGPHEVDSHGINLFHGHLILQPPDPPDRFYLCVFNGLSVFETTGWVWGAEAFRKVKPGEHARKVREGAVLPRWIPQSVLSRSWEDFPPVKEGWTSILEEPPEKSYKVGSQVFIERATWDCLRGEHRMCPGRQRENDYRSATKTYAGEQIRVVCSCNCHV